MAVHPGKPVNAALNQVAKMDAGERARLVRQLCEDHPLYASLLGRVGVARGVAFAAGLSLSVAILLLVQGASMLIVSGFVLAGLVAFGVVVVRLTDSRFDLLLAVLGAHRTDELHERLMDHEMYGEERAGRTSTGQECSSPAEAHRERPGRRDDGESRDDVA